MVSACSVGSSDMDSPELDRDIAGIAMQFNFDVNDGASTTTILYLIELLPGMLLCC